MTIAADIAAGLSEIASELGVAGTYHHDATGLDISVSLAVPCRTQPESNQHTAAHTDATQQDFIIAATELINGETQLEPGRNDTFTCTINETEQVFQVIPIDRQKRPWYWSDPSGQTRYRIHTKRIQ